MADQKAPAFIKLENYKNVASLIGLTREKIAGAKLLLAKINEIKKEEDEVLANWESTLSDVEERVAQSDASLLEPEV